jgi:hypothetical protein
MKSVQNSLDNRKLETSFAPNEGVRGGISLAEFIEHKNEESSIRTKENKGSKGLIATIISIVSFGVFKNIIG